MKINRRTFITGAAATATLTGIGGYRFLTRKPQARKTPNIVLFIADDMHYQAAGFAGNSIIQTPHLDTLARDGAVFDNLFVTTSICPTSRASILTGNYAIRHKVNNFERALTNDAMALTFPVLLREAGYHTGFVGKWGMGGQSMGDHFDHWKGFREEENYFPFAKKPDLHLTDWQTEQAIKFMESRPQDTPFLLIVSYKAPHEPLIPQARYRELYQDVSISRSRTDTMEAREDNLDLIKESYGWKDYRTHFGSEEKYQIHLKNYYRLITGIDDSVGQITAFLKESGLTDNTCVCFTSDNGIMNGAHQLSGKSYMYEDSIRTPLLLHLPKAYWPDAKPERIPSFSLNIDIAPTLLEVGGLSVYGMNGQSLLSQIQKSNTPWRHGFFYQQMPIYRYRVIGSEGYRGKSWKYTRYYNKTVDAECLFNLEQDPDELHNLANKAEYKVRLEEMRTTIIQEKEKLEA